MNFQDDGGVRFESLRSSNQELTFDALKNAFECRNMEFPEHKFKLTRGDGSYCNLALLLSDQCAHTVKFAIFQGDGPGIFRERCEFSGSLVRQMSEIYEFIDFRNAIRATFVGLYRNDVRDYPETAVREALLNLLTHRDYSYDASAFIRMYSDRLEFVSLGGLMPGIAPDDVLMGLSVCRNPDLAEVFHTLPFVEAYGTGIPKIMQAYEDCMRKPAIEVTGHAFKITLPNVNAEPASAQHELLYGSSENSKDRETAVLAFAAGHNGAVRRSQVEELLDISTSTASRLLRRMVSRKLLKPRGKAQSIEYIALKHL